MKRRASANRRLTSAGWLNQVEIYFSIVERKVLTPADSLDRDEDEWRLLEFGRIFDRNAEPFNWNFTRTDLERLPAKPPTLDYAQVSNTRIRRAS